jgi:aminoglycoside phosphotransferase (APT) family kinase protein
MNFVMNFLSQNWQRLGLQTLGSPAGLVSVAATPRFQASAHVIFFILTPANPQPILVVKVPRLPGDTGRLDREAENLRAVQALRDGGFDSIPKVMAYEDYLGHRLLVETAIAYPTMRPSVVRRQPETCIETLFKWLVDLHAASPQKNNKNRNWFQRLLQQPLEQLENWLPVTSEDKLLLDRTREACAPLGNIVLPLVVEHGDLSSPNILMNEKNQIGVVDWELAETAGLPVGDLIFFLTYVAFAQKNARKTADYVAAFKSAFFGEAAWVAPYLFRYCETLQIPLPALRPLFILCWARYVAGLVQRLKQHAAPNQKLSSEQVRWLRSNRFYVLWKYAIEHTGDLVF